MYEETMIGQSDAILTQIWQILHDTCDDRYQEFTYKVADYGDSVDSEFSCRIDGEISYPDESLNDSFRLMELVQNLNRIMTSTQEKPWTSFTMTYKNGGKAEVKYNYDPLPDA
jgi:Protein of unknown function, DUF600